MLEHLQRRSMQLAGKPVAGINPAFPLIGEEEQGSGPSLSDAIADFMSAPARQNNAEKTKRSNVAKLLVLAELFGAERSVTDISRADIRAYVEQLAKLPSAPLLLRANSKAWNKNSWRLRSEF